MQLQTIGFMLCGQSQSDMMSLGCLFISAVLLYFYEIFEVDWDKVHTKNISGLFLKFCFL